MTGRRDVRSPALGLAAPLLAIAFAALLASFVLIGAGDPVLGTFQLLLDYGQQPRSIALVLNAATTYYLSAVAVAIGFKMNLFNIGVDGQYRLAAMTAAYVGGTLSLPAGLHQAVIILTAVAVGAMWAGLAGLLKATRGVSEVISTIMLNAIATGLVAFFLRKVAVPVQGSNNIGTQPIPESGRVGGLPLVPDSSLEVFGLLPLAVLVGVAYWLLLGRTRFGFDLRATGRSQSAAVASGVDVKRMTVTTMLLSGAVAGLVGMPQLLGASYSYSLDFPAGLGFTGIAIALLGRNHPVGIAFGALLWAYLDVSSVILDIEGVSREIVTIMQGTIVLSVVVAYELVRRYRLRDEQRRVARELDQQRAADAEGVPA
ncbi:MAG TPA: ABC transporter permease [Mycobacteriales bacterium]|nr:ABC transporter permease [Mycobacteriales bacterium]